MVGTKSRIVRAGVSLGMLLVILDVTDQVVHLLVTLARLIQTGGIRYELTDVHTVLANAGPFTSALSGTGCWRAESEKSEVLVVFSTMNFAKAGAVETAQCKLQDFSNHLFLSHVPTTY